MKANEHSRGGLFSSIKYDVPAGIVVFLVAVPLCLGIALASGAPLFSGIIAGIVGGLVVGAASGSALGVSGPAAGLAVIVLTAITTLRAGRSLHPTWCRFPRSMGSVRRSPCSRSRILASSAILRSTPRR